MTQLDRRAAELSRFFPRRAVAAILGVDPEEVADLRGREADPIDPATGFRDPRFVTTIFGGTTELAFDDTTGIGSEYVDYFSLNMDSFADVLGEADEYLLEVYAYQEWKTTDEGSDVDAPIGLSFQLSYGGVPLPDSEPDEAGALYPLSGDTLLSSAVNFPTTDPDDFFAWQLQGRQKNFDPTIVRPPAPRPYPATRTWIVDEIATVAIRLSLQDIQGVFAADREEGVAEVRNTQILARLSTQDTLAEG